MTHIEVAEARDYCTDCDVMCSARLPCDCCAEKKKKK